MNDALQHAIDLRAAGRAEEAIPLLAELLGHEPDNGEILCQLAWAHDHLGREREAVPYYEQALRCPLNDEHRTGALLGLGSTYRTLGRYAEAKETLGQGMREYPDRKEFGVFYAMTLHNLGEHAEAMRLLLTALVNTSEDEGIRAYSRAIGFYADKLDQVWD
ncbi:tetratricopeptide repeat protein [Paenibacillus thiaminolyticus]|uniref:tetratricopeptide repeat protein n=1 Tax=Paenibacillus thiaminolyticus TaxID=49283 RepID=UPI003D2B730D